MLPPHPVGVTEVHVEQVLGEQVRLLAALGAADLDDHVLVVVGVSRHEQHLQLGLEHGQPGLDAVDLVAHRVAVVARRLGVHLLGRLEVVERRPVGAIRLHHRFELLEPLRLRAQGALVGEDGGVGQPAEHGLVLLLQRGETVEHEFRLPTGP